jgi:DNA-binding MarR family transcriptional regulator
MAPARSEISSFKEEVNDPRLLATGHNCPAWNRLTYFKDTGAVGAPVGTKHPVDRKPSFKPIGRPASPHRDEIEKLYRSGLSITEIAIKIDMSKENTGDIVRRLIDDGTLEKHESKGSKRSPETQLIIELYKEGLTLADIAERTGVKKHTISNRVYSAILAGEVVGRKGRSDRSMVEA